MARKNILHLLTPLKHVSPFDVNMAADAGYDLVVPYGGVALAEVGDLVRDAIFSRPPAWGVRTGIFFGGNDAVLALDMMDAAKQALVPPFGANLFADPAGSFTTAAAMVAFAEKVLRDRHRRTLAGATVAVFGGTGVVGTTAAAIAALEGADVRLVGYSGIDRVRRRVAEIRARFGIAVEPADGSGDDEKRAILAQADIVLCAARAGVRVLDAALVRAAPRLLVAADVNAVPPAGIEGIGVSDEGVTIPGTAILGIGALAVGNVKYGTQSGLFRLMIEAETPAVLDFRDAFALARTLVP